MQSSSAVSTTNERARANESWENTLFKILGDDLVIELGLPSLGAFITSRYGPRDWYYRCTMVAAPSAVDSGNNHTFGSRILKHTGFFFAVLLHMGPDYGAAQSRKIKMVPREVARIPTGWSRLKARFQIRAAR